MVNESDWSKGDVEDTYHIKRWGEGYFAVNDKGHLSVNPTCEQGGNQIDIHSVISEMQEQGITFPAVIRFHDVLRNQVALLNTTFRRTIVEAGYKGVYQGVYPVKVNQMREVVEEIVDAGSIYGFGLEAGSKTELLTALAYNTAPDALTILNGYKDEEFLRLALLGTKLNRKIVVVIEKLSELKMLIPLIKETNIKPIIGMRVKMLTQGRGKWCDSSGSKAKFGLTLSEILGGMELLKNNHLLDCAKLLHFHIGSQIPDINCIKEAITEGSRIYAKLKQMGVPLKYLDVGGGLGVDYEGTKTIKHSSRNYGPKEYASDVVYGIKQICDLEEVEHPIIVTESGRFITAYHSCIVTNVIGEIKTSLTDYDTSKLPDEHIIVNNMREILADLKKENIQEAFNDASNEKDSGLNAFKLGILTIDERAKVETLFWSIIDKIKEIVLSENLEFVPESLNNLSRDTASQYLCNFSVFQSALDSWAIGQLLPVVPIIRLNERPTVNATIADITCDSDGRIGQYVGEQGPSEFTTLHKLKEGENYYIGIFLTGAYQDVMGDNHNMFGRLNEVHVFHDSLDPTGFYIEEFIRGTTSESILSTMQYNVAYMAYTVKKDIDRFIQLGKIQSREGVKMIDFYEEVLRGYTYLN